MEIESLINTYNRGELQTTGTISIYGNYFGKPGDAISTIKEISKDRNILKINIGSRQISIESPSEISYNHYSIDINKSKGVMVNDRLYVFKENEIAFRLFNWSAQTNKV
jgi:hypothetical protein